MEELEVKIESPRFKILFDDEINSESVNSLVENIFSYQSVDLYVTTPGGALHAMDVLIDAINEHPDIKVILCGAVCSAGTFLLTDVDCEVVIHDNLDFIMIHGADRQTEGQWRKYALDYDILKGQLDLCNQERAKKFKTIGIPKKLIDKYLKGEDVYLYREDLKKLKLN